MTYNDFDAEVNTILRLYKGARYANDNYVNAHQINSERRDRESILVITLEHVIFMSK